MVARNKNRTMLFLGLLGLAVAAAIYIGLSIYQINLPGLHYDEAFEAVPALQLLLRQPFSTFRNAGLNLGQQRLPLMTQDYIGALNTYLALPFIAMLGATPTALRTLSVLIGLVTLGLTYALHNVSTTSAKELGGGPWRCDIDAFLIRPLQTAKC